MIVTLCLVHGMPASLFFYLIRSFIYEYRLPPILTSGPFFQAFLVATFQGLHQGLFEKVVENIVSFENVKPHQFHGLNASPFDWRHSWKQEPIIFVTK